MTESIKGFSVLLLVCATLLSCQKPAAAGQILKGRIEQIFGSQGELSAPKELEATAKKLDPGLIERKLAPNRVPT